MELHNVLNLAKRLRGRGGDGDGDGDGDGYGEGQPRYPKILAELEDSYFHRFGQQFIDDTRAYRGLGVLLHRQDAKQLLSRRPDQADPAATPRSSTPAATRWPAASAGSSNSSEKVRSFSYGLREIGNYYRQYVKLMDHWDTVSARFRSAGGSMRTWSENLEGQVRRAARFLRVAVRTRLSWNTTSTPSAASARRAPQQVRQPIYTSGLAQWRNYEPWLDPLKDALGPEVLVALSDRGLTRIAHQSPAAAAVPRAVTGRTDLKVLIPAGWHAMSRGHPGPGPRSAHAERIPR